MILESNHTKLSPSYHSSPFCADHKSSGSVKLEVQFSAHTNPSFLTVKLLDLVLMSSKAMSSGMHFCNDNDYNHSMYVYHAIYVLYGPNGI